MVIKSRAIGIIFINNKMQSKIDNTALLINRVNAYENKNCTNNRKIQTITLDNKIDTNEMGLFSIKSFYPKYNFSYFDTYKYKNIWNKMKSIGQQMTKFLKSRQDKG